MEVWNHQWIETTKTAIRIVRDLIYEKTPTKKLKRREQIAITRLRIGHTKLTHAHLINKTEPATCNTCNATQSVKHMLQECKLHEDSRKKMNIPRNNRTRLTEKEHITNLIGYLQETQLIYKL